ncbi:hypothetical protein FQA47_000609 [Oryzias melastigma]|uniref:Uncharacterized protein n=1 Tax=Oryzias melastigma TaxID=30732 RepID=A0A834FBK3_ORYME|nr:hypothetical protein FQA47_000609 [Oryzias melastigma]
MTREGCTPHPHCTRDSAGSENEWMGRSTVSFGNSEIVSTTWMLTGLMDVRTPLSSRSSKTPVPSVAVCQTTVPDPVLSNARRVRPNSIFSVSLPVCLLSVL